MEELNLITTLLPHCGVQMTLPLNDTIPFLQALVGKTDVTELLRQVAASAAKAGLPIEAARGVANGVVEAVQLCSIGKGA
jgi:hypothetical protein